MRSRRYRQHVEACPGSQRDREDICAGRRLPPRPGAGRLLAGDNGRVEEVRPRSRDADALQRPEFCRSGREGDAGEAGSMRDRQQLQLYRLSCEQPQREPGADLRLQPSNLCWEMFAESVEGWPGACAGSCYFTRDMSAGSCGKSTRHSS